MKRRKRDLISLKSLKNYSCYIEEIREMSKSNKGLILVDSYRKMINLDKIVGDNNLFSTDVKTTDAIHYDKLKNVLYMIEFKNGSIIDTHPLNPYLCNKINMNCDDIVREMKLSEKSKRKEIISNLALKGLDTYLIVLKKLLKKKEYELITKNKIKVTYIIVNSLPNTMLPIGNHRKQSRLNTLRNLDSISSKIPTILKRYEKEIFDKIIFESDSYFLREILPLIN